MEVVGRGGGGKEKEKREKEGGGGGGRGEPLNRCYTPRKSADLRMQCGRGFRRNMKKSNFQINKFAKQVSFKSRGHLLLGRGFGSDKFINLIIVTPLR